jgi:hypothetical protein
VSAGGAYSEHFSGPTYRCERPNQMLGAATMFDLRAKRVDIAVGGELLLAVAPVAIEAAMHAEHRYMDQQGEQRRIVEPELQQARYDASLAERLEKPNPVPATPDFTALAEDLEAAWSAPGVTMRFRQQLVRNLIADIIVNYDAGSRELVLAVNWRDGQYSELRVRKPRSGEHGCRTSEEALAVIRSMATRWSDEDIAATLNHMASPTGQGKTWTAHRVSSLHRVRGIYAYKLAEKDSKCVTMREAAATLNVPHHQIRRLIKEGILAAEQAVPDAPYQIRASDLKDEVVTSTAPG